jgi:hypothetical protein
MNAFHADIQAILRAWKKGFDAGGIHQTRRHRHRNCSEIAKAAGIKVD